MGFEERAAARKKAKELKSELKEMRKALVASGCDKTQAAVWMKDLQAALELGSLLRENYEDAKRYMNHADACIHGLLASMDICSTKDLQERLRTLVEMLVRARHECLIREDDLDFSSTLEGLQQRAQGGAQADNPMQVIMLRSELENVKAVLADAAAWSAPDFFALAYYCLHENREALGEMENEQRNALVLAYGREHFEIAFTEECVRAGIQWQVKELIAAYTGRNE